MFDPATVVSLTAGTTCLPLPAVPMVGMDHEGATHYSSLPMTHKPTTFPPFTLIPCYTLFPHLSHFLEPSHFPHSFLNSTPFFILPPSRNPVPSLLPLAHPFPYPALSFTSLSSLTFLLPFPFSLPPPSTSYSPTCSFPHPLLPATHRSRPFLLPASHPPAAEAASGKRRVGF